MSAQEFVIVGGGLAAGTAASTLREEGFAGHLILVAGEAHKPYARPPLSKAYLADLDESDVWVEDEAWWADHDVEVLSGQHARSLETGGASGAGQGAASVVLEGGRALPYDRLLIATGAAPRRLEIEGADAAGIHYLRTIDDSRAIRDEIAGGDKRVVVIGSGWIGMEVAATARGFGNDVTVLSRSRVPLAAALGDELGAVFAGLHEEHGVRLIGGAQATAFRVEDDRVTGVAHSGGAYGGGVAAPGIVDADVVVVGIGAAPLVSLAEGAGLEVEGGIHVDAGMRTTIDGVFAAGDAANPFHPVLGRRLRSEHWANAIGTGKTAALNMLGGAVEYDDIPYFYTDQFDLGMEYSGYAPLVPGTHVVYRGDRAGREFVSFWVTPEGRVVAGMNVNVWDVNEQVQALIRSKHPVDESRLADPGVSLDDLVAGA